MEVNKKEGMWELIKLWEVAEMEELIKLQAVQGWM